MIDENTLREVMEQVAEMGVSGLGVWAVMDDEKSVATDSKVMIEVNAILPYANLVPSTRVPDAKRVFTAKVLENATLAVGIPAGPLTPKPEKCLECNGTGHVGDCPECCGMGEHECDCGHEVTRKGSQKYPMRVKCRECEKESWRKQNERHT